MAAIRSHKMISVVIPSYNKGGLILHTVASVLASDYEGALEIIVVDDYSTDPLTKKAYLGLKKQANLTIVESGGKGPGNARNKGLSRAKGEYLLFLDNDDLISPNFIREALATLDAEPAAAYAYPDIVVFGCTPGWRPTPEFSLERLRVFNYIPVTCLYRIEALRAVGGMQTDLPAMEDWDLFLSLADKGFTGAKIPTEKKAWLFYRQADQAGVNASATSPAKRARLRTTILKRHHLATATSWIWNLAAIVFGALTPFMRSREHTAFLGLPAETQKAMLALIDTDAQSL